MGVHSVTEAQGNRVEAALVSWSGGKDCALAMYEALVSGDYDIVGLLTTVTEDSDRLYLHDIRHTLIEKQARALGLPWEKVTLFAHASNADYEPPLVETLRRCQDAGVTTIIFGDIFREDLRQYRAFNCAKLGLKAIFPLWHKDNLQLMWTFISLGFKGIVTSINLGRLDDSFVGRPIDRQFLLDFPHTANVCGEWGEYHTFVYDGPIFERPVLFTVGDTCERADQFHDFKFCDLLPA